MNEEAAKAFEERLVRLKAFCAEVEALRAKYDATHQEMMILCLEIGVRNAVQSDHSDLVIMQLVLTMIAKFRAQMQECPVHGEACPDTPEKGKTDLN